MGLLSKLFGRKDGDGDGAADVAITLDQQRRGAQLLQLEQVLDEIASEMRADATMDNPGWRARVNEYARLAGEAMLLRKTTITREAVLDLVFEVRPVFSGPIPAGMEKLGPLQDELLRIAEALRQLQPGERTG